CSHCHFYLYADDYKSLSLQLTHLQQKTLTDKPENLYVEYASSILGIRPDIRTFLESYSLPSQFHDCLDFISRLTDKDGKNDSIMDLKLELMKKKHKITKELISWVIGRPDVVQIFDYASNFTKERHREASFEYDPHSLPDQEVPIVEGCYTHCSPGKVAEDGIINHHTHPLHSYPFPSNQDLLIFMKRPKMIHTIQCGDYLLCLSNLENMTVEDVDYYSSAQWIGKINVLLDLEKQNKLSMQFFRRISDHEVDPEKYDSSFYWETIDLETLSQRAKESLMKSFEKYDSFKNVHEQSKKRSEEFTEEERKSFIDFFSEVTRDSTKMMTDHSVFDQVPQNFPTHILYALQQIALTLMNAQFSLR
ncbi:hypothetical protein BVX93_00675, partial [bacterium B13(2017)]